MSLMKSSSRFLRSLIVAALMLIAPACATTGGGAGGEADREVNNVTEAQSLAGGAKAEWSGDLDNALIEYVSALSANPKSAEAHFRVARVHARLGNASVANEAFQRSLAIQPDHAGALEGRGLLMLEQGRHDAARQFLHAAAARDNARWKTFDALGVLADLESKHELAQSYFGHALELQPDQPSLLNNMGYSLYLMGNYDKAQPYFERALGIEPGNRNAWSNLSLVYVRKGKYPQAVQALERIMDRPSALYSAGYVCKLDGKLADAEELFRSAIEQSPSYNAKAHAALAQVRDERAQLRQPKKKSGKPPIDRALVEIP